MRSGSDYSICFEVEMHIINIVVVFVVVTTHERGVVMVALSVCLSVCNADCNFESLDLESSFLTRRYVFRIFR